MIDLGTMQQVGLLMLNWHSSQWDPIYMVGSVFFAGKVYPIDQRERVEAARDSFEKMLAHPEMTRADEDDTNELQEIVDFLNEYLRVA